MRARRQDSRRSRGSARPGPALWARCSACRPGHGSRPRGFATAKARHYVVSTASLRRRIANCPTSLRRPFESDTSPSRSAPRCQSAPRHPCVGSQALHSAIEESGQLASRSRDCAGNKASRPAQTRRASFGGWHERTANATMLVPARLGVGLAFQVTAQLDVIYICLSLCRRRNT